MVTRLSCAALPGVAFTAALMLATAAQAQTYACTITTGSESMGWIANRIVVEQKDRVTVSDDIITHFTGKPIEGKLARENAKVIFFTWDILTDDDTNKSARMLYRLTIQKATGKAQVSATPVGYNNSFLAQGACALS